MLAEDPKSCKNFAKLRLMSKSQLTPQNYYELTVDASSIAGVDEVGRGALFGPVVTAAIILPAQTHAELIIAGVKDSKKLSPNRRNELAKLIKEVAQSYHIGCATVIEIADLNIRGATLLAMTRAVQGLQTPPEICLVDGRDRIPDIQTDQLTLIQGDDRSISIAAASILAKVYRDDVICQWAEKYPEYGLDQHKGYGTSQHRQALITYGATPEHRQKFIRKILGFESPLKSKNLHIS
jgi:ribonuclease HII